MIIIRNILFTIGLFFSITNPATGTAVQDHTTALSLTPEEQAWLKQHPTFTVGTYASPSFIIHQELESSGYLVELLQSISDLAGLEPEFHTGTVQSMNQGLRNGTLDAGMGLIYSKDRDEWLDYSEPFVSIFLAIYTRTDQKDISDLASLKGKTVSALKGGVMSEMLKKYLPEAIIIQAEDHAELFQMVSTGKADATILTRTSAEFFLRENVLNNIQDMGIAYFGDRSPVIAHYYGVREELPLLKSILDKAWNILPTAEKKRIWNRWFTDEHPIFNPLGLTADEQAWLRNHPVVRVPVFDFPPYLYWDNGPQGVGVETLNLFGRKVGFKIKYTQGTGRNEALESIRTHGDGDLLPAVKRTSEREASFGFTTSRRDFPQVIFMRNTQQNIHGLDALAGHTVVIERGSEIHDILSSRFPKIKLLLVRGTGEALKRVSNGTAIAYVGTLMVAQYHIARMGLNNLKVTATDLDDLQLAVAVRKDWPELVSILNKAIDSMTGEERNSISRKYFAIDVNEAVDYRRLGGWLSGLTLLIALILLWNYQLRRKVAKGTAELRQHQEDLEVQVKTRTAELHQSQAHSQSMLDAVGEIGEGLLVIDADYRIRHMNSVMIDWFGEQTGKQCYQMFNNHGKPCATCKIGNVIKQGKTVSYQHINQNDRVFDIVATPLHNQNGSTHKLVVLRDITERRQAEISLQELRKTLSESQQIARLGSWELDLSTQIITLSAEHQRITGRKPEITVLPLAEYAADYVVDKDIALIEERLEFAIKNRDNADYQDNFEYRLKTSENEYRNFDVQCRFKSDGIITGVTQDITERKAAEQRVSLFRRVLEQSYNEIYIFDQKTLHFIEVNQGARNNIGYSMKELKEMTPLDIKPQLTEADFTGLIQPLLSADREQVVFNTAHQRKDGSLYPVEVHLQLLAEEPPLFVAIIIDITDRMRKEAELLESEEKYRILFEKSDDAMLIISGNRFVECNDATLKMLGLSFRTELLNKHPSELSPKYQPDGRLSSEKADEMIRIANEQGSNHFEWTHIRADGASFPALIWLTSIPYQGGRMIHVVWRDLTETKRTEKKLITAQQQAEAANKAKSEFLANMSHEIRTPMNAIIGMSRLAMEGTLAPREQNFISKVNLAAESLLGIINDVLDFSKIEADKMEIDIVDFDLRSLLDNITGMQRLKAEEKGLELKVVIGSEVPAILKGDQLRIGQILTNLVNNAVKFTSQGGITITVHADEHRGDHVLLSFSVSDSGIGMTAEQKPKLFHAFSQAESSTTRRFGGTGLGLVICKNLTSLMGGEIWVESEAGQGARFSFTLQLERGDADKIGMKDGHNDEAIAHLQGARILLVEDNDLNQELAAELLRSHGLHVTAAWDGQEALDILETEVFDGILMDVQMPVIDGYAATRAIRRQDKFKTIPIIAMTANVMSGDRGKTEAAGMNDHIGKPLDVRQMFNTMAKWITPAHPSIDTAGGKPEASLPLTEGWDEGLNGIDTEKGLATTEQNLALYKRLLIRFHAGQGNFAELFKAAQDDPDPQAATRVAHTLKGVAGNIGAKGVQQAAMVLESACNQKRSSADIELALQQVLVKLHPVIEGLEGFIARSANEKSASEQSEQPDQPAAHQQVDALLEQLKILLKEHNIEAIQRTRELKALLPDKDLSALVAAVEGFDFEGAADLLTKY